jgi:hypothetical protein
MRRITVVVGHYGSGKTEFSVNYALGLAKKGMKVALIDLDIANPYFRSRERQGLLEENGISVFSNMYGTDITSDLPALDSRIRAPLEDKSYTIVVDAGGDESGARILTQYKKYLTDKNDVEILCVINGNRQETDTAQGALEHLYRIEMETGLPVDGLVNNTHMLKETIMQDIFKGHELCKQVAEATGIPLKYDCYDKDMGAVEIDMNWEDSLFPMTLYMRPGWLDR